MAGRHNIKRTKAERVERHRAARAVDVHTLRAHLLTPDALAADRHAAGRYVTICRLEISPASLTEPGNGYCPSCVLIPVQRSRSS